MLNSYLKIALRNLMKHKLHASINVLGLALGLGASILIILFARFHLTYDSFHEKADSLYMVYKERITPTGTQITRDTWLPMAPALYNEYSGIINATRTIDDEAWIEIDGKRFQETVQYVDSSFFDVFTFPFARGNPETIFSDLNSAVISKEIAGKYFGETDPIGKRFTLDYETDYIIRGILEDVPLNSTIELDIVVLFESTPFYERNHDNWGGSFLFTYIELAPGTSQAEQEAQFPRFVTKIWEEELNKSMKLKLTPLADLHNELTNANAYAYILLGVAFVILMIASINFMNLSTARSIERAREIGMRKVLGAQRKQLIKQFLLESTILSMLALFLGIGLFELCRPAFNALYNLDLGINYLSQFRDTAGLVAIALIVGLISGIYPALVLSGYLPVQSLKGKIKTTRSGLRLRSVMVVTQFCLAIILIIGTGVMWQQIQFMKNADLNFDKENVIAISVRASDFEDEEAAQLRLETFKNELRQYSGIVSVSSSTHIPGNWPGWFMFAYPTDRDDSQRLRVRRAFIDEKYLDTYKMELVEGRNFSKEIASDAESGLILNQAALRDLGWPSGMNHQIRSGSTVYDIIGIIKDYNYLSLASEVAPVLHFYRPPEDGVHRAISVRIQPGSLSKTLDFMREKWEQLDPGREFDYTFVDENFASLYEQEDRLASVTSAFTFLAILIACLGLFSLASLMVNQRTKEIGIRKSLGATVDKLVILLTTGFTKLVVIAFVIACPIAYYLSRWWLDDFAYRTSLGWPVFAIAGGAALMVAVLTVSYHAIKTAMTNPVECLRYE